MKILTCVLIVYVNVAVLSIVSSDIDEHEIAAAFGITQRTLSASANDIFQALNNVPYIKTLFDKRSTANVIRSTVQSIMIIPDALMWTIKKKALDLNDRLRASKTSSVLLTSSVVTNINCARDAQQSTYSVELGLDVLDPILIPRELHGLIGLCQHCIVLHLWDD